MKTDSPGHDWLENSVTLMKVAWSIIVIVSCIIAARATHQPYTLLYSVSGGIIAVALGWGILGKQFEGVSADIRWINRAFIGAIMTTAPMLMDHAFDSIAWTTFSAAALVAAVLGFAGWFFNWEHRDARGFNPL